MNFKQFLLEIVSPKEQLRSVTRVPSTIERWFTADSEDYTETISLQQFLETYGMKELGYGYYGTVYSVPNKPYVVKIFLAADEGYLAWIRFSQRNADNRYLPKFIGQPIKLNSQTYAIRVEKLRPSSSNNDDDQINDVVYDIQQAIIHLRNKQTLKITDRSLVKIAAFLSIDGIMTDFDLGDEQTNFMFRGNQVVITDPVAGRYHGNKPDHFNRFLTTNVVK